ncbi:hypothetical protein D3C71_256430 [compost metagenome]
MKRRTFIAGGAALLAAPSAANAAPVGLPAAPDLLAMAASMRGTVEGTGGGMVHILFTPWCHVSPRIWKATRGILGATRIHWIPFSGGQPEGREAVDRFFRDPSPHAVQQIFVRLQPVAHIVPTPLSDSQDEAIDRIASLLIRDTGRGMVTPTIIYAMGGDRVRVVPGGIDEGQFLEIARVAS